MTYHLPGPEADDAVNAFELERREFHRAKRTKTVTFGLLFLLAVGGSLWLSEVSVGKFVEGFPGLVAYIQGTLPVLRADNLVGDISEWYWGIGRWMGLLLDTLLIAFMGTLLGTASVFACVSRQRVT